MKPTLHDAFSLALFTLCLLPSMVFAPAWGQVAIPDTPAGQTFSEMLDALNGQDRGDAEMYFQTYGQGQPVDDLMSLVARGGTFELAEIVGSERLKIQFIVEQISTGTRLLGMLEVEDAEPARATSWLPWSPVLPGDTIIGFDINANMRETVIRGVLDQLNEFYVFAETATKMEAAVIDRQNLGEYDGVSDGNAFARMLTEHLQEVSKDKHLSIGFRPIAIDLQRSKRAPENIPNCAFERSEVLANNIGYLKLNRLIDPNVCRATVDEVLDSLADVDAVIFDMRDNLGGHSGMTIEIFYRLFDEPFQMSETHWRTPEGIWPIQPMYDPPEPVLADVPVYVLTSSRTFSGGEWFAYDLQALNRATVVGEVTAGGAHASRLERIDDRFVLLLPYARVVNPITSGNWEGTGVQPDVVVPEQDALTFARRMAEEFVSR